MRTIFEDTSVRADVEDARTRGNENKYTLPILWLLAIVFLTGTWAVYRWADNRPAIAPPAPPVSLEDSKQTAEAFNKFNRFVAYGNWPEAEAMLSTAAKQNLNNEQKSLRESLLGPFKDSKIVGAERTDSIDSSVPGRLRVDSLYKFTDDNYTKVDQKIIPMILVNENNKLVIDSWEGLKAEAPKPEAPKPEAAKPAEPKKASAPKGKRR